MTQVVKSFEFGVSLKGIEFVQNEDNITTQEGYEIVQSLIDRDLIESEVKTMGMVIIVDGETEVMTRPYVEDWSWDFDHPDTKNVII
jgi:hypothetical protein